MHLIKLIVGDWSGDGHRQCDTFVIESEFSPEKINKAYGKATKILGFDLIEEVCAEYEESTLDPEVMAKMRCNGIDPDDYAETYDNKTVIWESCRYADLYLRIVKLGDPSFEFIKIQEECWSIHIGGYGAVRMNEKLTKLQSLLDERKIREEKLNAAARDYFTDKSIPLQERWDLFCDSKLGGEKDYIYHFEALSDFGAPTYNAVEDSWLRGGTQRHESIEIQYLVENLDYLIGKGFAVKQWDSGRETTPIEVVLTRAHVDALMEECLEENLSSFRLDW